MTVLTFTGQVSDRIFAGDGDDNVVHVASERVSGDFNFSGGSDGIDKPELVRTQAELLDPVLPAKVV